MTRLAPRCLANSAARPTAALLPILPSGRVSSGLPPGRPRLRRLFAYLLRKIRKDDLIRFETLSGTHVYAVDSTRIVKPDDVAVLKPQAMPTLTLVTCYPFYYVGAAPDRFIVSAHEVPPEVLNASVQAQPAPAAQGVPGQVKKAALQPVDFHSAPAHTPTATRPADFEIRKGSSREVAPGISLGITDIDRRSGSVYGWIFLAREQRTILMTNHRIRKPVMFLQGGRETRLPLQRHFERHRPRQPHTSE